ncbi:IS21 family transposase [Candidatus Sumerlaeota bacterium]|nr:IS21 family transposase [Candidatus Sumerlaeota bacterium]
MLKVDQSMNIKELKHEGHSIRDIARLTGHSRNTVRKILRGEHSLKMDVPERPSKLDPYKDYLRERFEAHGLSAVRLIAEIGPMGYDGSVATLRRFLRGLRGQKIRAAKATVRFETPPGRQAQADWGYCGKHPTPDGASVSVYVFVIVLAYSRQMFVTFKTSMRIGELIQSHREAFEFFGGWTESILYDNMKQVRLGPNQWNEAFMDFAHHYGFTPKTHRPYRPRTKGKVERMVDYVKDNFLKGRVFQDLQDLNVQSRHWLDHTANVRIHATTGKRPCDLFPAETLTALDRVAPYNHIDPVTRQVDHESMLCFQGSRYSVPPEHIGRKVRVNADGGMIQILADEAIIAQHRQAAARGQSVVNKDHLSALWKVVAQQTEPPLNARGALCRIEFSHSVQQRDLALYQEVAQ